jgi:uncharacterized protein YigE (DUF2233 family)
MMISPASESSRTLRRLLIGVLSGLGVPAFAADTSARCHTQMFENIGYAVCDAVLGDDLRLFLNDADGTPYGSFSGVNAALAVHHQTLAFAMNGGMYHPDRRPVGHYVENGVEHMRVITNDGPGNFGLLPNGVFCIAQDRFSVIESRAFAANPPACQFASQSGPMLVIDGALHPRFLANSSSRYFRNGVGVNADGTRAFFVISNSAVTFHEFGRFFRDGLALPQALFFDGNISRVYAPEIGRSDWGLPMGPIVGLVVDESVAGG